MRLRVHVCVRWIVFSIREKTGGEYALSLSVGGSATHYAIAKRKTAKGEKFEIDQGPMFENLFEVGSTPSFFCLFVCGS